MLGRVISRQGELRCIFQTQNITLDRYYTMRVSYLGHYTPYRSRRIAGGSPTLFCLGTIRTNYFSNLFRAVSAYGGWVMIAQKPVALVYFGLGLVTY